MSIGEAVASPRVSTDPKEGARGRRIFPLHILQRQRLLGVFDVAVLNLGLLAGLHQTRGLPFSLGTVSAHITWFVVYTALWLTIASAGDNYTSRALQPRLTLVGVAKALALTEALFIVLPLATPPLPAARELLGIEIAFRAVPLILWRLAFAAVFARPTFQRRAIIVGAGRAGRAMARAIREMEPNRLVLGYVDDDPAKQGEVLDTLPVLGRPADLDQLLSATGATDIILAITGEVNSHLVQDLLRCYERGVQVVPMPTLYEQVTGRIPVEHIGDRWLVALPLDFDTHSMYQLVKRGLDVLASLVGLALLAPFLPLIALAIKLDSKGPIFYRPERLGQGGKPFRLWKLRTMVANADRVGDPTFTRREDSRITRLGHLLRGAHLDELPQFLNVLRGEMSLVGPRPERYVPELEQQIPFYRMRLAVRPGTAGWALVRQGYAEGTADTLVKLQYDLYYIKHQSLYLDLVILIRAAVVMLFRRGR